MNNEPSTTIDTAPFREYADLELEKRRISDREKEINKRMRELKPRLLDALDRGGVRNVPIAGLATVGLRRSGWARVVKDNPAREKATEAEKRRAIAALKEAGLDDLVTEGFNTHTVSALFRRWDEAGQDPPPELAGAIEFDVEYELSVTGAKQKTDKP